jgi:hypothetical protein
VDWWRGDWENRVTAVEDIASPPSTEMFSLRAPAHLRGTNASAGLLLTYPSWNVGLVYHAPFWSSVRFANTVRSTVTPPLDNAFDARFQFPRSIAGGVAWRPAARWTAALAVTHDQWTEALVEAPGLPGPINFFDNLPPEVSTTRDTVSLNFGVEHLFVHDGLIVPLRLGAGWEPQGEMDEVTRDPVDYLLFSAGTGYNTNRFKLDLAVQWRRAGFRSGHVFTVATAAAQNIYGESLARDALGDAVSHEWRIKVSAIYRLQDTTKLKGIFKKIFG